jgi:hypothetical protein
MKKLVICYHGTNARAAREIVGRGFSEGTHFAAHLEDALGYGGAHVFEVAFPADVVSHDRWQFTIGRRIPPSHIVSYRVVRQRKVVENQKLRQRVFRSNR